MIGDLYSQYRKWLIKPFVPSQQVGSGRLFSRFPQSLVSCMPFFFLPEKNREKDNPKKTFETEGTVPQARALPVYDKGKHPVGRRIRMHCDVISPPRSFTMSDAPSFTWQANWSGSRLAMPLVLPGPKLSEVSGLRVTSFAKARRLQVSEQLVTPSSHPSTNPRW